MASGDSSRNTFRQVQLDGVPARPAPPGAAGAAARPVTGSARQHDTADQSTADALEVDVRAQLQSVHADLAWLRSSVAAHRERAVSAIGEQVARARAEAEQRRSAAETELDHRFVMLAEETASRIETAVAQLAPGAAGAGWSAEWSDTLPVRPAQHLRFGTVLDDSPAIAPFLEHPGWLLAAPEDDVLHQVRALLVRLVAQIPLRFLRIRVLDPRIEGQLGVFARLRDAYPEAFPPAVHGAEDLADLLREVTESAAANAELIAANHVRTLGELWELEGRAISPYTVLVILGYPSGVDETTQATLVRLARTGPARGVSLVVQHDRDAKAMRGVKPKELFAHLVPFESAAGSWTTSPLGPLPVRTDPPVPRDLLDRVVTRAADSVTADTGPVVPLADLIAADVADPWRETADDVIEATIGRRGRESVTLALRSENPPHPNLLIGGAVGQGKSNLLLDIVYSLAARYAPTELEMLLLDFKQGLEFKRFDKDESGRNWLPHARILSLESSKPFGLAVLEFVAVEMERRAELFNAARCNGYTEYRERTAQPIPRMLLIIDEFQVLFDGDDDLTDSAVRLFETLAKQGRAFGIHILLSSQTISGISGFRVKGDSIFAQFPLRVSLKNTREESEAILSRQNTAAAELTYRGEVIVNRNLGMVSGNERAVAGFAESEFLRRLQEDLWSRDTLRREPWVFLGRSYARWPNHRPDPGAGLVGWVGRPIAVTDDVVSVRFERDVDQAVAVVGSGEGRATAVLGSMLITMTAGWEAGGRILVLDGNAATADRDSDCVAAALDECRERGVDVEVVARDAIARHLVDQLRPMSGSDPVPTLVLALGLPKVPDLETEFPADPDDEFAFDTFSALSVLRDVATTGATRGVFLIGWWPNVRSLGAQLSFDHAGVGTYVMLQVGIDDLRSVVGPHAIAPEGNPRVLVFDRNSERGAQVVVPFEPAPGGAR